VLCALFHLVAKALLGLALAVALLGYILAGIGRRQREIAPAV
jgi:hypothetical protein